MADQLLDNANCQLFNVVFETNEQDITTCQRPLLIFNDNKHTKYSNTNNDLSLDNNNSSEMSDEYDYDSDCSLGSANSLYLNLNKGSTFSCLNKTDTVDKNQLQNKNGYFCEKDTTKKRLMTNEGSRKEMKLNPISFYGKQASSVLSRYDLKLSYVRNLKKRKVDSAIRIIKSSVSKSKINFRKPCTLLKKWKQKNRFLIQRMSDRNHNLKKNKHLIRYKLKENIPLLKLNHQVLNNPQTEKYLETNSVEKSSQNDKINFAESCKTIVGKDDFLECLNIENVEKKLFESNTLVFDDFSDKNDFGGTKEIENNILKLFEEDVSLTDSQNNIKCNIEQWNGGRFNNLVTETYDHYNSLFSKFPKQCDITKEECSLCSSENVLVEHMRYSIFY